MRLTRGRTAAVGVTGIVSAALALVLHTAGAAADGSPVAQTRNFTVAAVPLLVHEQTGIYGFLQPAFAPGGVLDGKEVYGWNPSHLVVQKGDRVHVAIVNPTGDPHTFTAPDLSVNAFIDAGQTNSISFVANRTGAFTFMCTVSEHAPYMNGQVVVLPASGD